MAHILINIYIIYSLCKRKDPLENAANLDIQNFIIG